MPPEFSAQRVIRAYFNGCKPPDPKQPQNFKLAEYGSACKTKQNFGFEEQYSICPSLIKLLQNAKDIFAGKVNQYQKEVIGASQGLPVDARFLQNILRLNGARLTQLKGEPEGLMRRAIFNWCVASASAAAERHHATFIPLARAYITSSTQVSSMEKDKLMMLLGRRTEEISAEKRVAMAAFISQQGAAIYSHRADVQAMAEAAASTAAGMRDMANLGYATTITDNQEFYNNGGGG